MAINSTLVGTVGQINSGTSVTTGSGTTSASGSTFTICVAWFPTANGGADISGTPTDSKSNTYVQKGATSTTPNGDAAVGMWVCENGVGGAGHTATANFANANGFASIYLTETTGEQLPGPTDIAHTGTTTNTPYQIASGALAQAVEVILTFCVVDTGTSSSNWTSPNSTILDSQNNPASFWPVAISKLITSVATSQTVGFTYDTPSAGHQSALAQVSFKQSGGVAAAPFVPQDQQGPVTRKALASDSISQTTLKPIVVTPLAAIDLSQRIQMRWVGDFLFPNPILEQSAAPSPYVPVDISAPLAARVLSASEVLPPSPLLKPVTAPLLPLDLSQQLKPRPFASFDPPNLLADLQLKPPPITQEDLTPRVQWKGVYTDFFPPNLQSLTLVGAVSPLAPIDLSQQVRYRWSATEQIIPNLTLRLPIPPIVPSEWNVRLVARGIYTDFATPNLILSNLAPPPAAPLVPQDHTLRLSAIPLASDFIAPNLTIILPQAPPIPPKVPAGRHRRQADERRRLEVLRAKLQDFEQRKRQAQQTLIQREEGEQQARAKVLRKIKIRKPVEQYAPVANAIVKRVIAQTRHQDIARQLQQIQAEHDQISDAMDEEAALHFMHFLMRLSFDE